MPTSNLILPMSQFVGLTRRSQLNSACFSTSWLLISLLVRAKNFGPPSLVKIFTAPGQFTTLHVIVPVIPHKLTKDY